MHFESCIYFFTESTAYRFGSKGGIISFTYPQDERKDREHDSFALGFISEKDGVIIRIDSATSNDYIEMEMVSCRLFYNRQCVTTRLSVYKKSIDLMSSYSEKNRSVHVGADY